MSAEGDEVAAPVCGIKGELLGGNDIIQEMAESGELQKTFDEALK